MKKNRLLIIQPGKFGDIIICLPIAKWYYDLGYAVEWECQQMYHEIFRNVDYVKPVVNPELEPAYDKILDLSFGFGGAPQMWWNERQTKFDSFVTAKYELAQVPLEERWNLVWNHNELREWNLHAKYHEYDYSLIHREGSIGANIDFLVQDRHESNPLYFTPFEDYNIFDWYEIIKYADDIHCIDSSLANFIEVIPEFKDKTKYLYDVRESYQWLKSIYKNNWIVIQ